MSRLALLTGALLLPLFAAGAPPKPAKPAPPASPGRIVLGTNQLPGEFGKFGLTYTVGKESPLNFTLLSAEYRADRFIGTNSVDQLSSWVPNKQQKLLVIKYTVQNPNPTDTRLWYLSFEFAAVSADDQNSKIINHPWIGDSRSYKDVMLKPAQKATLTAAFLVPAEGEVPKLIVQRSQDPKAAVIRYDLRGKVAKMKAPWSEDGYTALPSIPTALDTYVPWQGADLKVIGLAPMEQPVADLGTPRDKQQYALRIGLRGVTPVPGRVWYGQFRIMLKLADGDLIEINPYGRLLRTSSSDRFDGAVPDGEEMTARLVLDLPPGTKVAQVKIFARIDDQDYRTYVFDLPVTVGC